MRSRIFLFSLRKGKCPPVPSSAAGICPSAVILGSCPLESSSVVGVCPISAVVFWFSFKDDLSQGRKLSLNAA